MVLGLIRRHPGYILFATSTMAVSVGVNMVVFTIVNALWLRPVPYRNPERLVAITANEGGEGEGVAFVGVDQPIWGTFEAVAGQVITSGNVAGLLPRIALTNVGRNLETVGVTPGYFHLLGLTIRGRDFTEDDNRWGAEPVAIISNRFGRRSLTAARTSSASSYLPRRYLSESSAFLLLASKVPGMANELILGFRQILFLGCRPPEEIKILR